MPPPTSGFGMISWSYARATSCRWTWRLSKRPRRRPAVHASPQVIGHAGSLRRTLILGPLRGVGRGAARGAARALPGAASRSGRPARGAVDKHVANVLKKLGLGSRDQIAPFLNSGWKDGAPKGQKRPERFPPSKDSLPEVAAGGRRCQHLHIHRSKAPSSPKYVQKIRNFYVPKLRAR